MHLAGEKRTTRNMKAIAANLFARVTQSDQTSRAAATNLLC
nr:MAG TPA: hypothetical protein [Bacteriophage sp.]